MGPITSPLRRRGCLLVLIFCVIIPFTIMMMFVGPDLSVPSAVIFQRLGEVQIRLQYLESMYRTRQEDVSILTQYISIPSPNNDGTNVTLSTTLLDALSPETRSLLRNISAPKYSTSIHFPNIFSYLPYLVEDPNSLRPAYLISRGRSAQVILGIPTVKREKQTYLMNTLHNMITNMNEAEQNETMIVVFVGETKIDDVLTVAKQIEAQFPQYIESGLIEVLSAPESYYPDMDKLRPTLNDPMDRVKWRSKQNLDYAFLMAYSQSKCQFYVQLEDDILSKRGFVTIMKNYAIHKTARKEDWFVLDFCQLGFIGKMFKSTDLSWIVTFIQMFYNDKPVDWILDSLVHSKVCGLDHTTKECGKEKATQWIRYKPSLFQHVGTTSSLKGKVQKLKDSQFGKLPSFFPHKNPVATVKTTIKSYKSHTLARAYLGQTFFWGVMPQAGDVIDFTFHEPVHLRRYKLQSGNNDHPLDRLNAAVEVRPDSLPHNSDVWNMYNSTGDGFLVVGNFNDIGIAAGMIDANLGQIKEMRLNVLKDSENWVILSEILFEELNGEN